jgi:hypothetical protein
MKSIVENARSNAVPFRETIPFWFAVLSPLIGILIGLLGAWFIDWISM